MKACKDHNSARFPCLEYLLEPVANAIQRREVLVNEGHVLHDQFIEFLADLDVWW